MPFTNVIDRTDAAANIPEQVAGEVIGHVASASAVLAMFRRIPVARGQVRFPILSALPTAYWVTGDTGLKQTTEMAWANRFLNIEELAAIVPIPDNVVDDAGFDIWGEVRPALAEAIGKALDAAVLFGVNAPASFPASVWTAAQAAGNENAADSTQAQGGIYNDLDEAYGQVEDDGFDPNGIIASRGLKGRLRRVRNVNGDRIAGTNEGLTEYNGDPVTYAARGLWPTGVGSPLAFVGDWQQFVVGVRKDITYSMSTDGVIQDNTGTIVYNLFQQDMSAMRVVFRAGWQVANPLTPERAVEAARYPAAVVEATA